MAHINVILLVVPKVILDILMLLVSTSPVTDAYLILSTGVPLLEFSEDPINTIISEMAGGNITRDFFTFGYPSPNITLRRKTGDSYTTFESSKVVPSTKTLIINGVERSDSGDYQIVATNTYGSYMLNFTLNITGLLFIM